MSKEQNMKLNLEVGQRIKSVREYLGLTRKDLAERSDISDYFLTEIESGRKGVSHTTLCKIADVLCVTTDYLLRGKNELADVTTVIDMLTQIDQPLVKGAEDLLKIYIGNISFIKKQLDQGITDTD